MRDIMKTSAKWIKRHWLILIIGSLIFVGLSTYLNYIRIKVGFTQWSGFEDKTLWDILELVIIPIVLVVGSYLFSRAERQAEFERAEQRVKADRAIATNNLQEAALQTFIAAISELLLEKKLRKSSNNSDVSVAARARTLATLRLLDGSRKAILIRFLYEAQLIIGKSPIISLDGADLRWIDLSRASLKNVNLSKSSLHMAIMKYADLQSAYISDTNLHGADLNEANLSQANLSFSCLAGSNLLETNLSNANLQESVFGAMIIQSSYLLESIQDDKDVAVLSPSILAGANLTKANLTGAKLSGVDLTGANLKGANLTEANFDIREGECRKELVYFATMDEYILSVLNNWSQLNPTQLERVNFTNANLTRSSFHGANLTESSFDSANITEADFSESNVSIEQLEKASSSSKAILPNGQKIDSI